ncbi:MAG: HAD-IA family hydrolase [Acidimicrobiia bacterium]
MSYRAVIFDLGGVVFPSPFDAFAAHEEAAGLPPRFIRTVVAESADHGAWARFERSELAFEEFCTAFESECAAAGGTVDAAAIMRAIMTGFAPHPEMVEAIGRLRAAGLRTAALTNNWARSDRDPADEPAALGFDLVVESAVEGIRKPDPAIYELVCTRLAVAAEQCVFLDDLGVNLKPARALGMTTIKVVEPRTALAELGRHLDLELVAD